MSVKSIAPDEIGDVMRCLSLDDQRRALRDMMLIGSMFVDVLRDGDGRIVSAARMDPERVQIRDGRPERKR